MNLKIVLVALCLFVISCKVLNHRTVYNPDFKHEDVEEFKNIHEPKLSKTKYDKVDFLKPEERVKKKYFAFNRHQRGPGFDLTHGYDYKKFSVEPNMSLINNPKHNIQITFIGHATFLIQLGMSQNILTDPQFTKLPFAWLFEKLKRHAPPGIDPYKLPKIHAVTISHDHYDHLDLKSLEMLNEDTDYLAPLGFGELIGDVSEKLTLMDWYTNVELKGVAVTFLPVQHWSKRGLFDKNERLWGGYLYASSNKRVFFAGDTGYSQIFSDINRKVGPIDICLFPIISYEPFNYRKSHITPEDALKAAEELKCKVFIPWGQGTFTLGNVHMLEPLRRLEMAYKDRKWPFKLKVLKMGETFTF